MFCREGHNNNRFDTTPTTLRWNAPWRVSVCFVQLGCWLLVTVELLEFGCLQLHQGQSRELYPPLTQASTHYLFIQVTRLEVAKMQQNLPPPLHVHFVLPFCAPQDHLFGALGRKFGRRLLALFYFWRAFGTSTFLLLQLCILLYPRRQ